MTADAHSRRYRTIVADPPWQHAAGGPRTASAKWNPKAVGHRPHAPYETLAVPDIAALPVGAMAEGDAHLYLWTTNAFVRDAYTVAEAWGFTPSTLLTWCKAPRGLGPGGAFAVTTEFVLFARRGSLAPLRRMDSTWWQWKRPYAPAGASSAGLHSAKPEAFLDHVEQVSPGPYVELFARRARFGWDYWGDQSLSTAEMPGVPDAA